MSMFFSGLGSGSGAGSGQAAPRFTLTIAGRNVVLTVLAGVFLCVVAGVGFQAISVLSSSTEALTAR